MAILALVALVAVGACTSGASVDPASPVVGVVIDVDSAGLDDVKGFTLRLDDGREIVLVMGDLENPTEFPPAHVGEHLASGVPVSVWFRSEADDPVVYRIEDAGQ